LFCSRFRVAGIGMENAPQQGPLYMGRSRRKTGCFFVDRKNWAGAGQAHCHSLYVSEQPERSNRLDGHPARGAGRGRSQGQVGGDVTQGRSPAFQRAVLRKREPLPLKTPPHAPPLLVVVGLAGGPRSGRPVTPGAAAEQRPEGHRGARRRPALRTEVVAGVG